MLATTSATMQAVICPSPVRRSCHHEHGRNGCEQPEPRGSHFSRPADFRLHDDAREPGSARATVAEVVEASANRVAYGDGLAKWKPRPDEELGACSLVIAGPVCGVARVRTQRHDGFAGPRVARRRGP